MEFNFSIKKPLLTENISSCIQKYAEIFNIKEKITGWNQKIITGFMTGFIDLIFRNNDKYYIVDWKSNKLESTPESFKQEGLKQEMAKHYYFLQYLIYTVALNKYLSESLTNYDYDKNFGGVFYIFLRGVNQDPESDSGIFHDKPDKELIEKLSKALGE